MVVHIYLHWFHLLIYFLSNILPTTTASLNLPSTLGNLSSRVEIRRLSDPRLMQHLLETVDSKR